MLKAKLPNNRDLSKIFRDNFDINPYRISPAIPDDEDTALWVKEYKRYIRNLGERDKLALVQKVVKIAQEGINPKRVANVEFKSFPETKNADLLARILESLLKIVKGRYKVLEVYNPTIMPSISSFGHIRINGTYIFFIDNAMTAKYYGDKIESLATIARETVKNPDNENKYFFFNIRDLTVVNVQLNKSFNEVSKLYSLLKNKELGDYTYLLEGRCYVK